MIKKMNNLTSYEVEEIVTIWLTANCEAHPFIPEDYWQKNIDFLKEELPKSELYVYCEENKIIGFLGMNECYIAGIFVMKSYRNQGIGQQLLNEVKQLHDQLTLSVYAKNKHAVNFYKKQGFQQFGEQVDQTGELEYQFIWEK